MKVRELLLCSILSLVLLSGTVQSSFLVGDLDGDCRVDFNDLSLMALQWLEQPYCPEAGLFAHWKFDQSSGSTAVDSSLPAYDGVLSGPVWRPSGGILGGALEFDGIGDYVWIQGSMGIVGSDPRTCSAWIKTDQAPGHIMTWGATNVEGGGWLVWLDEAGVLCVDVSGGFACGSTVLTDDRWRHVAVTFDGSTMDDVVLYVDGKTESISYIYPGPVDTQPGPTPKLGVYFGSYLGGHYFKGLIDDARIYDRALDLKEIWYLAMTASTNYECADLNSDGTVNLTDLGRLAQNWAEQTPQILINEFLASNQSRSPLGPGELLDGNGDPSDWIELYNNSRFPIDISRWYLTDDADDTTQWRFPDDSEGLTLEPGEYLIVFASGKTEEDNPDNYPYVDHSGYLHTNFRLSRDGEYLGLYAADGTTVIHEYNHISLGGGVYGYPVQSEDISYGYYYGQSRYFANPTPGADNIAYAFEEVVDKPAVDIRGGSFIDPVEVTLTCETEGAVIRYTTDGSAPDLFNGKDYSGPITLEDSATLIAKAFKPGLQPSDTRIETYIFLEPDLAAFDSNLPIVIVDTLGRQIPHDREARPFIDCQVIILDTDEQSGRASIVGLDQFEEKAVGEIRYRGQSTYGTGHYALEFRDEYGEDKYVSLLGLPPESDFVLSYDRLDFTLLKKELAFKWFRDMGHYSPRQRYVEVFVNKDGGKISENNYYGLMVIREDINRDQNRVDIARLDAAHDREPRITGGYIIKNDKWNEGDTKLRQYLENDGYGIHLDGGGRPVLQYPPARRVTQGHIDWITDYINEVMAVLWQNTSSDYYPGPEAVYTDYLDVTSWIDHFIVEQITNDADAFWGSYRTHKEREGKIYSGPPWDFDRSFHNNGINFGRPYNVWRVQNSIFGRWHQKLQEDLEYRIQLADRWYKHRKDVINTEKNLAYIDQMVDMMSPAMARPQKKNYSGERDWATNVGMLRNWIVNRLDWLDDEIAGRFAQRPPIYSPAGGYVNRGDLLHISKPPGVSGDIYYTLNGEDPRLPGGQLNPDARLYSQTGGTFSQSLVGLSSSVWKYLYDGSDQATAWRAYDFDDSSWGSGPGLLGFGQDGIVTDIGPKVNYRRSAYFRHKFNVSNVSEITQMQMTVLYDDGAVIYINDQEVGRINMPAGEIHYDTLAVNVVHAEPEIAVLSGISPDFLEEGENILAVSVHQQRDRSSDLAFDMELKVTRTVGAGEIVLDQHSMCVKSRIKDGENWSALNHAEFKVPTTLLHFWAFTDDLANNTPLLMVDSSYSLVGSGAIEYHSALQYYPFNPGDDNWRKASMERRNTPTGINYRPEGNDDRDYDENFMRALQIRQPFHGDGGQNMMGFHLPTQGYENIVFKFAAMDEGAAQGLIVDYSVAPGQPQWQTIDTLALKEGVYQAYEIDFSEKPGADDNPDFKVRIRFDVADGQADEGNRVTFNNFSLEAFPLAGY